MGRLLHRQVRGFLSTQNAAGVVPSLTDLFRQREPYEAKPPSAARDANP
jgi:hypothetical protein